MSTFEGRDDSWAMGLFLMGLAVVLLLVPLAPLTVADALLPKEVLLPKGDSDRVATPSNFGLPCADELAEAEVVAGLGEP